MSVRCLIVCYTITGGLFVLSVQFGAVQRARGETLLFNLNFAFGAIDGDCLIKVTLFIESDKFQLFLCLFLRHRFRVIIQRNYFSL